MDQFCTVGNTWIAAKKDVAHTARHNELSIGASAALWECALTSWLSRLYQTQPGMQFEARIAQRQSLVKQLHERQLDLLITTEAPKMDELSSQRVGEFTLALYCHAPARSKMALTYLRMEWGPDFQQYEADFLLGDTLPVLTTSSVEIAVSMLSQLNGCTWLPTSWADQKAEIHKVTDSSDIIRPFYAVWLQNSDKLTHIKTLLKTPL